MTTINVHENGFTFIAEVGPDMWDKERIVCALWATPAGLAYHEDEISLVRADGVCVAVGDGADSYAAIEDAMWEALAEMAHMAAQP